MFPQGLGNSPKAVAEAITHEVGHNLALEHDGTSTAGYYSGHGSWAPIMGVGYDRPITQWSKGEYAGANNSQDDLATIAGYLARRADEPAGAAPRTGYITSDTDSDVFVLGGCASGSQITVDSPYVTPDLDVRARLLSPDGVVLATADPASGTVDATRAYGMDATLSVPSDGRYLVEVAGASSGQRTGDSWSGYSPYGSIGAYRVTAGGCDRDVVGVPSSPTALAESAPATTSTLSLRWAPPTDPGASPVTGYTVTTGTGDPLRLGPDSRGVTLTGLTAATTYDVAVTAVNARGPGLPASLRLRTATPLVTVPSAPTGVTALWNTDLARPEMYWQPPASDGGSPRTGYALTVDGASLGQVGADWTGVYLDGVFAPGEHTMTVAAVNAAGTGPAARAQFTVPDAEGPVTSGFDFTPRTVDVTTTAQRVTVSVRLTDATGAEAPTVGISSDTTTQSDGGTMTRVSGTVQDGRYERTVTFPSTAAVGTWTVTLAPTTDTLGNLGDPARDHPQKLMVTSTPITAPGAPTGVVATPGDARAEVRWSAPTDTGGAPVTSYTVTGSPGGATATVAGDARTATLVGLTNGTAHRFTVTATSSAGTSAASAASAPVVPAAPPAQVGRPGAAVRGSKVVVTWQPATPQGSPVTGYTVLVSGERAKQAAASATRLVVRGVSRGRHTVRVTATNALGTSPPSAATSVRVR